MLEVDGVVRELREKNVNVLGARKERMYRPRKRQDAGLFRSESGFGQYNGIPKRYTGARPRRRRKQQMEDLIGRMAASIRAGEPQPKMPAGLGLDDSYAMQTGVVEAVADGMLLITGACGGIHPALPGRYVADYGDMGRIEFTVT